MKSFNIMVQTADGASMAKNYTTLELALAHLHEMDKSDYEFVWIQKVYGFEFTEKFAAE
jgi:hypothetical protein